MRTAFCLLLSGFLCGQDPAGDPEPRPLLELRTGADLIQNALIRVQPAEGALPEDGMVRVTVEASGVLRVEVEEGDPGLLHLRADPAGLFDRYREDLGVALGVMRGIVTLGMIQHGVPSKEAMGFFEVLVDAPKQVRDLELTARKTGPGMVEVDLVLAPAPGTWFARVCEGLRPLPQGPLALREAEALASLAVAVDPEVLPVLLEPLHTVSVAMMTRDPDERRRLRSVLRRATGHLDGTLAVSVDADNQRITQLVGIRDAEGYRRLRESEDHAFLSEHMTRGGALMRYERMPDALKHRGVRLERSAVRLQLGRLGVAEGVGDSPFLIYTGLVEDQELTLRFDPDFEEDGLRRVRDLVDRTLDGHLRRMPVPNGALLRGEIDLRPAKPFLEPLLGTLGIRSDPPRSATVAIRRVDAGLNIHLLLLF